MTSAIDPSKPISGNPTTQSVRDNFLAAKNEIDSLQLSRILRLTHVAPTVEIFQQVTADNTLQVVQFNQQTFLNPNDNSVFEWDSVNNEIIFHETGWYAFSASIHIDRKTTSGADSTWSICSQLKVPSGSFVNFPESLRKFTLTATTAITSKFVGFTVLSKIDVANTRLRMMQAATDSTKQVGIVSYPPVGVYPGAPGITISLHKVGAL